MKTTKMVFNFALMMMFLINFTAYAQSPDTKGKEKPLTPMTGIELNSDQKLKLKTLNQETKEKNEKAKAEITNKKELAKKLKEIKEEQRIQREAILTPEQVQQFNKNVEEIQEMRQKEKSK